MKKNLLKTFALSLICGLTANGQNFEGEVKYSRVNDPSKMFANNPNAEGMRQQFGDMLNQARRPMIYSLTVKGNEFMYKPDKGNEGEETSVQINGQTRTFRRPQPKDETYFNTDTKKFNRYEEYAQQPFNISGDIKEIRWKVDPVNTKKILDYECMKATATETEIRKVSSTDANGKLITRDSTFNNTIVAWFTDAIPSSAGPDKYSGLPGLVLEIDINNGVTLISAQSVTKKEISDADLKVNSKGKKVSSDQLKKIKEDHQAEMMKNFGGRGPGSNTVIIRN